MPGIISGTREMQDQAIFQAGRLVNQVSVVRVDVVISELPGRHLPLEHNVHLLESTILGLWQTKEAPNGGEQRQAAPEEGL